MPELSVRSAGLDDLPLIADLYARVSPSCFAERFRSPRRAEPVAPLARFDPSRGEVVLLAFLPGTDTLPIAEARYSPTEAEVAEFSIVVLDSYQGQGHGRTLLAELQRRASQQGLRRLAATVPGSNTRMLRLVGRLGWALVNAPEFGIGLIEISTDGGMPGWPDDGRRRVLVESRSWFGSPEIAALATPGSAVRRCPGPRRPSGPADLRRGCPLVVSGRCRLAEEADEIINLLPGTVPECVDIGTEHARRWPQRLRPPTPATLVPELAPIPW